MWRDLRKKIFPMPKFLLASSFGLDLSDESVKFVGLVPEGSTIRLGHYGERKIPPGIVESGRIKDPKGLKQILLSLHAEEGVRFVRGSLPEEQVYLFQAPLAKEGLKNVREGIELSLEDHVPIQAENAVFDYEILGEDERQLDLEVAAIQRNVIENYLHVFEEANMSVQSFELEAQAIARAVIKKGDPETYMIVDFGRTRTGIFIVSRGVVVFTSTLPLGGKMLDDMIAKNFNVDTKEAERMKIKYGLERSEENKEIFSVLLNNVSVMRDEIQKHFVYWHTHKDEEGRDHPSIRKIILTGGDANLNGLADYLSVSTKSPVELGDVWINIEDTAKKVPEITFRSSLGFAAALGLALGDFEHD